MFSNLDLLSFLTLSPPSLFRHHHYRHHFLSLFLLFALAPALSSPSSLPNSIHVGIFAHGPISKGLFRDAETLIWALQKAPSLGRFLLPRSNPPNISV
jgi:hypothetical protein